MTLHQTWLLSCLRRYLVPLLLLLYLAGAMLGYLVAGDAPQPQIPPDGHVSHTRVVRLSWYRGGSGPYRLQVIPEDGDFDTPLIDKTLRSAIHTLKDLQPGEAYRWRVIAEHSGRTSREASFSMARYPLR